MTLWLPRVLFLTLDFLQFKAIAFGCALVLLAPAEDREAAANVAGCWLEMFADAVGDNKTIDEASWLG